MQLDTQSKLGSNTLALHWIVGIMMIMLLAVGVFMEETKAYALYPWHKAFGVLIIFPVILRVVWRIKSGWPPPVREYKKSEKILSKFVHYLLLIGTVILPISGFMMSAMGGHGVEVFGLELVPRNPDPANPMEVVPLNGAVAGIAHELHALAGTSIIIGVILHTVGVLKHHILDKDGTLLRMLGAKV
ncbi:MAG: cytochrome b [Candidatus Electrothrix sp. GW3-4]|uniref:cytochrome b n=1 Tax=Candidatus Electrothrix sp. GW3-4 TaxID=3126740 RepID=UPI0030CEC62D